MKQILVFIAVLFCTTVHALTYEIDPNSDVVGAVQHYVVQKGDTLQSIARKFDLGYLELLEANPRINRHKALPKNSELVIPTEFVLPRSVAREGIVLNVAELRLYYFLPNTNKVYTFPVSIGRAGWTTPTGKTKIAQKRPNPVWVPPPGIRAEAEANGYNLPDVVPAGPHNPLGQYAINFDWAGYRMHGTNAPSSIGLRTTHGCIRLFPEDIDTLFHLVEVGTPVNIVHEPYKVGIKDGQLYLEAHQPAIEMGYTKGDSLGDMFDEALQYADYPELDNSIDWRQVTKIIKGANGYPMKISNQPDI